MQQQQHKNANPVSCTLLSRGKKRQLSDFNQFDVFFKMNKVPVQQFLV